jgi:VanZ family protein
MQTDNRISFKKFIPGIVWMFVIFGLIMIPGKELPESEFLFEIDFDKFVHAGIFGLMAVLFSWPFYKTNIDRKKKIRYFIIIALLTSCFGYCTELMQKYWAEGRSYDLMDWLADSTGALGAFIFCRILFLPKNNSATSNINNR